ncbi:MAG TPA: rod shape-determining protein MreC [Sedimentisphaerales bacterium]|nr:rod shape-determining protein MreC [Sedimentisphaerales bacterium]
MLFTWFMLTGLILLFAPHDFTGKFQLAFVHIFRWPLSIGGNVALTARTPPSVEGAKQRSEAQYRNYVENLKQTLDEQTRKLEKLSGLYNTFVWEGADFALADVIIKTIDGSRNEMTINCRKTDGLMKGQYVLGDESVIGTISEVFPQIAKADVKLVTDSTSWIPVEVAGIKTIMTGSGNNAAKIVALKKEVKVEEKVFALKNLKEGGFLDAPIIVGKVVRCERNTQMASVWDLTVAPVCDIKSLEDVAVIIINPPK